jgi:uncharacterized oligopeptide transporter (OPT) family protein
MLMSFIIDGIMSRKLPWSMVLIGAFISIMMELLGLSSLAFAVGVYLPISTSMPIMIGGIVRWLADRGSLRKRSDVEAESGPGILFSSGLIAGASVTSMMVALVQLTEGGERLVHAMNLSALLPLFGSDLFSILVFMGLSAVLWAVATERFLGDRKAIG